MWYQRLFGAALEAAQRFAKAAGQDAKKAMPGELIFVVPLDAEESDYEIDLGTETGVTKIPIEKRLTFRDNFAISGMSVGVLPVTVDSGGNALWGADHAIYWEDPGVFSVPVGAAKLSESQCVAGVWNGHMTFQNNEETKIVRMPLRGFRTVQTTQQATITPYSGGTAYKTANEHNGNELKSLGGIVKVAGGNENKILIHIECKDKTNLVGTSTRKNYLYVVLRGAFIKGGTIAELQTK